MRSHKTIGTVLVTLLLFIQAVPAAGQDAIRNDRGGEDWGDRLENGIFWGQIYGGLAAQSDKTTWKNILLEIIDNTHRVTLTKVTGKSLSGQTQQTSAVRQSAFLQFGGSLGIARYSFPEAAADFFGESGFTVSTFMGGARMVLPQQKNFLVYVQGYAGLEHAFGENAFAIAPEGGIIFPVNQWLLTVTGGPRIAFYEGASETAFELSVGLTFPLGHK